MTQLVDLVAGEQTRLLDTCLVRYQVENRDTQAHTVGLRVMLDTYIGGTDGVPVQVPGRVGLVETMAVLRQKEVPAFLQAQENADPRDPGTVARMGFTVQNAEPVAEVRIARWPDNSEV